MTRPSKKAAEREIVERVLSVIGLKAEIDNTGVRPDIILKVSDQTIGVEVTTYQSDKTVASRSKKARVSQREVEAAWERFEFLAKLFDVSIRI